MKQKPFNLERALAGDPVVTRSGDPARIVATNVMGDYPVLALITEIDEGATVENPRTYTINGAFSTVSPDHILDLRMMSTERVGFVVKEGDLIIGGRVYKTHEMAVDAACLFEYNSECVFEIRWEE